MKTSANLELKAPSRYILSAVILAFILISGSAVSFGQSGELSLADLLIGLRSKKATIEEKNRILTSAVNERGITFSLTPEIEKELTATGANQGLLRVIRIRAVPVRVPEPIPAVTPKPTPIPTPTPPDFQFFTQRADENSKKGEYRLALADYNKAADLKKDEPSILFGRGNAYFSLKDYDLSIADFDSVLKLSPKDASAYIGRARVYEEMGEAVKAADDYRKAMEIDPENKSAKENLIRLLNKLMAEVKETPKEPAKNETANPDAAKAETAPPESVKPEAVAPPEYIDVGMLSKLNAIKMAIPVYPQFAQRTRVEGRVVVDVELNVEGFVTSAKAVEGPQLLRLSGEDAAKKSRFKPALFNGNPIKAKGRIIYNFSLRGSED